MSKRYCAICFTVMSQHEVQKCRRCRTRAERAKWLRSCGRDMDEFQMETTGSDELDVTIAPYRGWRNA